MFQSVKSWFRWLFTAYRVDEISKKQILAIGSEIKSLQENILKLQSTNLSLAHLDLQSKLLNDALQQIAELRTMVETPERRIPKVMPRKWSQFRDAVEAPNGNL